MCRRSRPCRAVALAREIPRISSRSQWQTRTTTIDILPPTRHWRYISSFHGPWLQLPPEILETLANINYNTPRPRPIDPAVFYDLVKIRRLVDDATNLAVRAASGVASVNPQAAPSAHHHTLALGLGLSFGQGGQAKLSRERKQRLREQATQKLSKAYRLDEIACSVATMQSSSPLEEVASLVLQRKPYDVDAKYVHFFHEKIPSRQLADFTTFNTLNEVITERPTQGEPLRTRATIKAFKNDFLGVVSDLTDALRVHRLYRPSHKAPERREVDVPDSSQPRGRRPEDVILKEEDQPSSLETQLLFHRANAYFALACRHIHDAVVDAPAIASDCDNPDSPVTKGHADQGKTEPPDTVEEPEEETPAQRKTTEARKLVKVNAKRALRDYIGFLSHLEYAPDLPIEIAEEFARKTGFAANNLKAPRTPQSVSQAVNGAGPPPPPPSPPHRVYSLSELFNAAPPADLPPYPSTELVVSRPKQPPPPALGARTTTETLTYHPLLTEVLHSVLLCHVLVQTSAKELLRHAYMVARLSRLADGYPVFQASRSPAKSDWMELLRSGNNWIQLAGNWEDLCCPAPVPLFLSSGNGSPPTPISLGPPKPNFKNTQAKLPGSQALPGGSKSLSITYPGKRSITAGSQDVDAELEKLRKERLAFNAMTDSLGDERANDEASFRLAIRARQIRAERDYQLDNAVAALDAKIMKEEIQREKMLAEEAGKSAGVVAPNGFAKSLDAPSGIVATTAITSGKDGGSCAGPKHGPKCVGNCAHGNVNPNTARPTRRPLDEKDLMYSTDRANAVTEWLLRAPPNAGGSDAARRRKKKPVRKAAPATPSTPSFSVSTETREPRGDDGDKGGVSD